MKVYKLYNTAALMIVSLLGTGDSGLLSHKAIYKYNEVIGITDVLSHTEHFHHYMN